MFGGFEFEPDENMIKEYSEKIAPIMGISVGEAISLYWAHYNQGGKSSSNFELQSKINRYMHLFGEIQMQQP
jgi:hypothetical protein